jgi:hypothetical protein
MNSKGIYILCGAALVVIVAVFLLNMPDRRSGTERVGDAVEALPNGVDKAGDQLKDRNPVEKAGDALSRKAD